MVTVILSRIFGGCFLFADFPTDGHRCPGRSLGRPVNFSESSPTWKLKKNAFLLDPLSFREKIGTGATVPDHVKLHLRSSMQMEILECGIRLRFDLLGNF